MQNHRDSKEYTDVHGVLIHAYNSQKARVEHLGFHKALCVLMGWNYTRVPDNSKAYQLLSEDEAAANKEDLTIWPPIVLIHNTNTGKQKDGRMDGVGNKEMDTELRGIICFYLNFFGVSMFVAATIFRSNCSF